jgi:hypothetical protein
MRNLKVTYDRDYGIDRRRGWSVSYDGICLVEFRPTLLGALWKAWRKWRDRPSWTPDADPLDRRAFADAMNVRNRRIDEWTKS